MLVIKSLAWLGSWRSSNHGSKVNFSGKIYQSYSYGIDETGDIDLRKVQKLANEHKPKLIICGFSAFSGVLDFPKFREMLIPAYLRIFPTFPVWWLHQSNPVPLLTL